MSIFSADIKEAVNVMRSGGVILYPTDTVWGIGCDARNSNAVARIFNIKRRQDNKALITLVGSWAQLERTVAEVPDIAYDLLEFSERPTTIVYDAVNPSAGLAPNLIAPDGTIAVRLTKEPFSAELCRSMRSPIVSTSANISGHPTPRRFADIDPEVIAAVDYICISRRDDNKESAPSVVMRLSADGLFKILRP